MVKQKHIIILALLLISSISNAQFSYKKLLDNDKPKEAFTKAQHKLRKKPRNVIANYDMSMAYIYLNKKDKKQSYTQRKRNAEKAFSYANKALKYYKNSTPKETAKYNKKGFTIKKINRLQSKACDAILKTYEDNIASYKKFINKYANYPKSVEKAQNYIYNLAYEQAMVANDIKMYKDFIKNYPYAPTVDKAKSRIVELEKQQAEAEQKQKDFLSQTHDYSHLKAVIVLGIKVNINYDYIDEVKKIFTDKNIEVKIFKPEDTQWNNIVKAAKGANFFLYIGHGTFEYTSPTTFGGLVLQDFIFNKKIKNDLKLAPNAVVLMQSVCFSAGSSAGDVGFNIGVPMAKKRVTSYAKPYIENGAAVYYANSNNYFIVNFLNAFFKNQSPLTFYNNQIKYDIGSFFMKGDKKITIIYKKEINEVYQYSSKHKICFSSSKYDKKVYYSNATVFKPDFSIVNLLNND